MKPIKLKLKGINSFIEEQEVDFNILTKDGMFGIFGSTGSGKSTIIDGITLALFGELSRFDGEKGKQFINSLSDTAWVSFEFELLYEGRKCIFIAERSYKKVNGSPRNVKSRLTKNIDGNIEIITDQAKNLTYKVERLLGLEYKDFSRSVVLPQGKFSQFLLLANLERKSMLERIFGLEKYGDVISNAVKNNNKDIKTEIESLNRQLEMYGYVSNDILKEDKLRLNNFLEKKIDINSKLAIINEENEKLKIIFTKHTNLNNQIKELENLNKNEEKIEGLRLKTKLAVSANKIEPVYKEIKRIEDLKKTNIEKLNELENAYINKEKIYISHENKYNKWKIEKEESLPKLIEWKVSLQRGVEIRKDIDELKKEREGLLSQYKITNKELMDLEKEVEKNKTENNRILEQFNNLEEKKKASHVEGNYRQATEEGYNLYNIKTENIEKLNDNNIIIKINKEKLQKYNKEKIELEEKTKEIDIKTKENEEKLSKEKPSLNRDDIVIMEQNIFKIEIEFKENEEKLSRYKSLKKEIEENEGEALKWREDIEKTKEKIERTNLEIDSLEEKIKDIENINLASILSEGLEENMPCPVCGSKSHPIPAKKIADDILNNIKIKLTEKKDILNKEAEKENKCIIQTRLLDETIKNLNQELEKLKEIEKYNSEETKEITLNLKSKIKTSEEALKEYEEFIKNTEIILSKDKEEINGLEKQIAILEERVKSTEINNQDKNNENTLINDKIKDMDIKLEEINKVIKTTEYKKEYENIQKLNKESEMIEKELVIEKERLDNSNLKLSTSLEKFNETDKLFEKIKTEGKGNKQLIDKYESNLSNIYNGENINIELKETSKKIDLILEKYEEYDKKYQEIKVEIEKTKNDRINIEKETNTFNGFLNKNEKDLEELLRENGFTDREDFKEALIESEEIEKITLEIREYELTVHNLNLNVKKLKQELKGLEVSDIDEKLKEKQKEIEMLDNEINVLNEVMVLLKKEIDDKTINLQKTTELRDKERVLSKRAGYLDELNKLFEGKKFVDFVSGRHLRYIVVDASKRLKEMSGGRYAIELDETNFIIRDDFNGGVKRSPKTLSGGETFMASLCLALALSTKVQLESKSSLEFFFLDEGFGSLDGETINTVMEALLKLQSQNIKVGLITHVEELKNQTPVRLIVEEALPGGRGTRLKME